MPVYGDGAQVRNWLFVEDFASAIDVVLERGEPGQAYNVGGPTSCPTSTWCERILELTGRDESLIEYVDDRPGHDRRYSLASTKLEGLGWKARGPLRRGDRAHRRLVPRQRGVVGAAALRRLPRVLRAPVRPKLGELIAVRS